MKHFITTQDWNREELENLLTLSKDMKLVPERYKNSREGKSICMFFYNPSTRTRNSTQVAAYQLGMYPIFNSIKDSWIGYQSESIKDTSAVLSPYSDVIGIRIFPVSVKWKFNEGNRILREFAKWSSVPIINFEDDKFHPLQALTDIFTIREHFKDLQNKKIVISWAYHPKPLPLSVPNSILLMSTRFGMDVTLTHPEGYELNKEILSIAKENASESNGALEISNDITESYSDADVIYIKSWGSRRYYGDPQKEKKLRLPHRENWRIKSKFLDATKSNSLLMHCLPIRRNIVADDEVIDGNHSVVYEQAENRLYTVKAVLYELLDNKD